ncbi:MAG TPA: hypothetical protein VFI76_07850, partial [Terrimicrobiaceae bacterium]|nr:hypothetical protein [Terrimicrobiaceae bacterium]
AICVYLHRAMTEEGAKLEPEHLLRNPLVIVCTLVVVVISAFLTWTKIDLTKHVHFFESVEGRKQINP